MRICLRPLTIYKIFQISKCHDFKVKAPNEKLPNTLLVWMMSLKWKMNTRNYTYLQTLKKCKEINIFIEKNYLYYNILCFTAIDWKKCFITSDILNFPLIFPMKIFGSLHFCNVWAYMRKVLYVVSWVHFLFRSLHSN